MKRFHLGSAIRRASKVALCGLLAVAMVVPACVSDLAVGTSSEDAATAVSEEIVVEAADTDLPDPVLELDFESGFLGEDLTAVEYGTGQILVYSEETDSSGSYYQDSDGNWVFAYTDTPAVESATYKYAEADGNQPSTYYDSEFGNVLMLNTTKCYAEVVKDWSDDYDEEFPVGSVVQEELTTYSAATTTNPFIAYRDQLVEDISDVELTEDGYTWSTGVTISYWVKAADWDYDGESSITSYGIDDSVTGVDRDEQAEDNVYENDSVLITFQNDSEDDVYQVDDIVKYEACQGYDNTLDGSTYVGEYTGTVYTADMYKFETTTITDDSGTTWQVVQNQGIMVRANPNYPGTSSNMYYIVSDSATGKYTQVRINGETKYMVELGFNVYNAGYNTLDIDEGSVVKRGQISGSLTILASGGFAFAEDDYYTDVDENGVTYVVQGATQTNKNADGYGEYLQLRYYNQLYFYGDQESPVLEEDEDGNTSWHYMTCVITNDWVGMYVDGELVDESSYWYSYSSNQAFGKSCTGKYFNKAYGLGASYADWGSLYASYDSLDALKATIEWSSNGTMNVTPSNTVAQTLMEWITDEDTELLLGGYGSASGGFESVGSVYDEDGTLLDDISFYVEPLTEDQVAALYEEKYAEKYGDNTVEELLSFDFTDDAVGAMPAGMSAASTNTDDSLTQPQVVNDAERGHVLKISASTTKSTAGAVLDTNPFSGQDLSGATISFWYKGVRYSGTKVSESGTVGTSMLLTFQDTSKLVVHSKLAEAKKTIETKTVLYIQSTLDATFNQGYDTEVQDSIKNMYKTSVNPASFGTGVSTSSGTYAEQYQEWTDRLDTMSEWHYVTMVVTNAGITVYYDGVALDNNLVDTYGNAATYGPRFYDGYYDRINDMFCAYKVSSNNQGATPLMTFLEQDDTSAYIGVANADKSSTTYQRTYDGYYDDITYYAGAMTAEQVAEAYTTASAEAATLTAVAGEEVEDPYGSDDDDSDGTSTGDAVVATTATTNSDGSTTYTGTDSASGITVSITVPAGALDSNAELVLTVLGTTDSASAYSTADTVLSGISGLSVNKRILFNAHFEVDGVEVTPTAACTVEVTPPSSYTLSRTIIVYIPGSSVMSTTTGSSSLTFSTSSFGNFAIVETTADSTVTGSTASGTTGSTSSSGTTAASQTGDAANAVLPILLLAAAFAAMMIVRRRKVTE